MEDLDSEEDTGLPPAQFRKSLLDPTQPMTPLTGHHQSIRLTQSVDRPKHTNPKCNLCPGLPPGVHFCRETGMEVKSCKDCKISRWLPPKTTQQLPNPHTPRLPSVPQLLGNNGVNRTNGESNRVNTQGSKGTPGIMTPAIPDTIMVPGTGHLGSTTNTLNTNTTTVVVTPTPDTPATLTTPVVT